MVEYWVLRTALGFGRATPLCACDILGDLEERIICDYLHELIYGIV